MVRTVYKILVYSAPASVTVEANTTEILAESDTRMYASIVNDSDNVVYLAVGADAVMNKGIRLNANGGSFEMNRFNLCDQAVNGITLSPGNVTVQEAE